MTSSAKWTPFIRQCFVTSGVVLNVGQFGVVMSYTNSLLPQLRSPDSEIQIDDISGSWIASIVGLAFLPSIIVLPIITSKLGRRGANLISIIPCIVGWIILTIASSTTWILTARFLQGLSLGICSSNGSILIGEYTSPRNRGAFLSTLGLAMASGTFFAHVLGLYLHWRVSAVVYSLLCFLNLLIVIYSPESPSWYLDKGRYEESVTAFRWLRGDGEEEELKAMLEANIGRHKQSESKTCYNELLSNLIYFKNVIKKRDFYKPALLTIHVHTLGQWSGPNIFSPFINDATRLIIGADFDPSIIIFSGGILRVSVTIVSVYIIKKFKRRTMLISTTILNLAVYASTAIYTYSKTNNWLPYDHPSIGVFLILFHMLTFVGCVSLPFIIAGELFPLEYRNLSTAVSSLTFIPNMLITVKTALFLFDNVGLHGTYCIHGSVVAYCLLISYVYLPETKDRTLQDVEDEIRGVTRNKEGVVEPFINK